jgi:hypothetical protein
LFFFSLGLDVRIGALLAAFEAIAQLREITRRIFALPASSPVALFVKIFSHCFAQQNSYTIPPRLNVPGGLISRAMAKFFWKSRMQFEI